MADWWVFEIDFELEGGLDLITGHTRVAGCSRRFAGSHGGSSWWRESG